MNENLLKNTPIKNRCAPEMEESQIQSFYKHRNVFITGGTGFMGKVLIEKLLRSTEVSTLYLLIREKKGKNIHTRIDEIFDDVVFDTLKRECPKFKHRIEAIPGDCSMSGLGICMTDRQTLISKIDIVFHVAATVKFDESLNLAYTINVNGTKEVVDFARQMMNLKSLIYVSTAYANCPRSEIDEKVYDHVIRYEDVKAVLEKLNKSEAELLTPRILGAWPNTYTFTKFLAESLIKDIGGGLPIGIFRPSIVISTYKEPLEGWIDNLYGPTGVAAGAISGVLRVMPCARERTSDVVPVDSCVAGLISAAWDVSSKNPETKTSNQLLVYNYVSSAENPITWREFIELNIIQGEKFPVLNSLWEAFVIFTPDLYWYWILRFFCHTLPGFLIDLVAILTGNKPRMMQLYKTIHKFADTLSYFATRSWKFSNKNTCNLWHKMNRRDRELFPLSMTTVHWLIYFRRYIKGIRLYLLKESDETLEAARRKSDWFRRFNMAFKCLFIYIICNCTSRILSNLYSFIF
ncbi:fatty acyl-CoA reductase wat [Leptinotarsa decemlineata]|uniref:fatty acyl-CoA reductase wat n=1 Tax=Leptinotarsa decemlineata TaxID=7539 RepID=UPI003D309AF6